MTDRDWEQELGRMVETYSPMLLRAALTRVPTPADAAMFVLPLDPAKADSGKAQGIVDGTFGPQPVPSAQP